MLAEAWFDHTRSARKAEALEAPCSAFPRAGPGKIGKVPKERGPVGRPLASFRRLQECRTEMLALLSSQGAATQDHAAGLGLTVATYDGTGQEWGIPPERVVLAGFSMGGTVAAWTALQAGRGDHRVQSPEFQRIGGLPALAAVSRSFAAGSASPCWTSAVWHGRPV